MGTWGDSTKTIPVMLELHNQLDTSSELSGKNKTFFQSR